LKRDAAVSPIRNIDLTCAAGGGPVPAPRLVVLDHYVAQRRDRARTGIRRTCAGPRKAREIPEALAHDGERQGRLPGVELRLGQLVEHLHTEVGASRRVLVLAVGGIMRWLGRLPHLGLELRRHEVNGRLKRRLRRAGSWGAVQVWRAGRAGVFVGPVLLGKPRLLIGWCVVGEDVDVAPGVDASRKSAGCREVASLERRRGREQRRADDFGVGGMAGKLLGCPY
jgi:hypothetical protein